MSSSKWFDYFDRSRNGENDITTAKRLNVAQSAITRWRQGHIPKPQQIVAVAREYGLSSLTSLMYAGYLDKQDLQDHGIEVTPPPALEDVPLAELMQEIQRRAAEMHSHLNNISEYLEQHPDTQLGKQGKEFIQDEWRLFKKQVD